MRTPQELLRAILTSADDAAKKALRVRRVSRISAAMFGLLAGYCAWCLSQGQWPFAISTVLMLMLARSEWRHGQRMFEMLLTHRQELLDLASQARRHLDDANQSSDDFP